MYKLIKYFLIRPFLVWLLIFQCFKTFFLIYHYNVIADEAWSEIFHVYFQAIKLDISSISYILIIPFLLMIVQFFTVSNLPKRIHRIYLYIILFSVAVLNVVDIIIYNYWASKISLKALLFLDMPGQVLAATGSAKILMGLVFIIFHFFIGKFLLDKLIFKTKISYSKSYLPFLSLVLFSAFLIVVGIRGGLQNIPINQSVAYYSKNNTLNIAGVNPFWNFMNAIVQNGKYLKGNPYLKIDKDQAENLVNQLFETAQDSTINILKIARPNIVFLTMEGINANVFKSFGSQENIAPHLDSLLQTGYLFTEFYSSGFRSDQGLVAMLGGFPPLPVSSIAAQPEKFMKLPSFAKTLQNENYDCSFFMGVEPEFGNLKSYLVYNNFHKLIDIKDFPINQRTMNLGVPDEFLFQKFTQEMQNPKEPFFSMIFTATTHEPYDMDFNKGVADERQKYLNTVSYLDSFLVKSIEQWKTLPWYKNTLFVLTSDHAHYHPGNYEVNENERFHVPFLIFGEPLIDSLIGKKNNNIFSQVDIPKSILKQLKMPSEDFVWSKDIMNPFVKPFAFYTYVEGYVLKTEKCNNGWEYRFDMPYGSFENRDSLSCQQNGQAFLQVLYDTYLSY